VCRQKAGISVKVCSIDGCNGPVKSQGVYFAIVECSGGQGVATGSKRTTTAIAIVFCNR
jgi:hypothetical protein